MLLAIRLESRESSTFVIGRAAGSCNHLIEGSELKNVEDLKLVPVWVNPGHLVESAIHLMKGHGQRAIAVMEGSVVLGVVSMESAVSAAEGADVRMVMRKNPAIVSPRQLVVKAAQQFVDEDLDIGVVMDEERFYGVITPNMLLKELRRSWDPLTGLGWSDRLREWGIDQLTNGREITILFVDLDKFGQYNKLYGHLVGDRVLRRVAQLLKDSVDPKRDVLVRYGGDEFAIATLRPRDEAEELASRLLDRSGSLFLEDAYQPVTFSIGLAGGRRSTHRPDIHVAAMFDELVNAASRDMLSKKLKRIEQKRSAES